MLIGYSPCYGSDCATAADNDRVFDAETVTALSAPTIDFYSFAVGSTKHLAIQGRGDFVKTDSFQLGYKCTFSGTSTALYTLTATHDGLFNTQPYYIYDAADGNYHSLPYTFSTLSGTFDSRFKVVFENLTSVTSNPVTCGTTLSSLWYPIYSLQVAGATTYKFEVRTGSATGPVFGVFNGYDAAHPYTFNLNLSGILFNTNYWVAVATYQVDGQWAYGPSCMVTTPSPPTSKLVDVSSCGVSTNNYWKTLYATTPTETGHTTTGWRFQVSTDPNFGSTFGSIDKTVPQFALAQVGSPQPSTVYYVRIQIKFDGNWQVDGSGNSVYGPVCTVTTTIDAHRTASENNTFEVEAYPNPFTNSFRLAVNTSTDSLLTVKIFDLFGREIEYHQKGLQEISAADIGGNLRSGVYTVIVKQGEQIKTLRIIKR